MSEYIEENYMSEDIERRITDMSVKICSSFLRNIASEEEYLETKQEKKELLCASLSAIPMIVSRILISTLCTNEKISVAEKEKDMNKILEKMMDTIKKVVKKEIKDNI